MKRQPDTGEVTLSYRRFFADCGPESPFILPSEMTGTEPDGIRQQQDKPSAPLASSNSQKRK